MIVTAARAWWVLVAGMLPVSLLAADFQAGVGRIDITPTEPVHLAGYATRAPVFTRVEQKVFVKALALKDDTRTITLLVTADTLGTPRWFNDALAERIGRKLKIPRARFLYACSHSHSTPVIKGNLDIAYGLTNEAAEAVARYTTRVLEASFAAAAAALTNLEPVTLSFGRGEARFAVNRRQFTKNGVVLGVNPTGLVDHGVPVLCAARTNGAPKAIVFGYACHCTTPGATDEVSGDWAGYAQECLERAYPGGTALFITGCGGDANPEPRRDGKYVAQHGLALAGAVATVLDEPMVPVGGPIQAAFDRVALPLGPLPSKKDFASRLRDPAPAVARFGKHFLGMLDRGEPLPTSYPCPVQVLRFGKDLLLVAMGGEVVVDYAYRLRRELPAERLWTAAYCNDVFAYVPSVRVLAEGGYEADFNMIYYGLPTRFAPEVENLLVEKVLALARQTHRAGQ